MIHVLPHMTYFLQHFFLYLLVDEEIPRAIDEYSEPSPASPVDDVVKVLKRLYSSYRQVSSQNLYYS